MVRLPIPCNSSSSGTIHYLFLFLCWHLNHPNLEFVFICWITLSLLSIRTWDKHVVEVWLLKRWRGLSIALVLFWNPPWARANFACLSFIFFYACLRHAPLASWPVHSWANRKTPSGIMASDFRLRSVLLLICTYFVVILATSSTNKAKKKDIRDYNDADMARLLEQWEVRLRATFIHSFLMY